jgi:hypothetical protein
MNSWRQPGHHRQLQRQLAAGLGRDDAGRDARLLPAQPAGPVLALRAGRCEHACFVAPTVAQLNAEALSALGLHAGHSPRLPGDLRPLPVDRVDEVRRADGRYARDKPDELHDRPDGAPLRRAMANVLTLGGAKTFDAQAGYESATTLIVGHARGRQLYLAFGRAGTRRACTARSPSSSSMRSNAPWPTAWPRVRNGTISTKPWPRSAMWGRGDTTSAIRTRRRISRPRFHAGAV